MSWQQQRDEPLFPDMLWSRPEHRRTRGKLLIVGGQQGQFMNVAACYEAAVKAGAGHVRVLLPDSLQKLTSHLPDIEYAPSNQSGSFSSLALGIINELSEWADGVVLAGDFGKNSQTTTMLDGYLLRCPAPVTISSLALSAVALPRQQLLTRPITLVLDDISLQRFISDIESRKAMTSSLAIATVADILGEITASKKVSLVAQYQSMLWVSVAGNVTSTKDLKNVNMINLSAYASTWLMQQPTKPLEALTTACFELLKNNN